MGTFARSTILAATFAALLHGAPAHAQLSQSWVSGEGVDTNPCTRVAPCQTFSRAISVTNAGGSIECLDAGGFGNVTITKSIIIDCAGRAGGILALSPVSGVTVNGAGIKVVLRGLNIYGAGSGLYGIDFINGASLHVENSTISRFTRGIYVHPPAGVTARLVVVNSSISEMTDDGLRVVPTGSGIANVEVLGSSLDRNRVGLLASASAPGSVRLMIENSSFSLNRADGIAIAGVTGAVNALISGSVVANNEDGFRVINPPTFVRVSSTTISGNVRGWGASPGAELLSFQDNGLGLNLSVDGAPSGTIPPQ